jgi:hypothetical protein
MMHRACTPAAAGVLVVLPVPDEVRTASASWTRLAQANPFAAANDRDGSIADLGSGMGGKRTLGSEIDDFQLPLFWNARIR